MIARSSTLVHSFGALLWYSLQRLKHQLSQPQIALGIVLLLVLLFLVVRPLIEVVAGTLTVHSADDMRIPGAGVGELTRFYWERTVASEFSARAFYKPLQNTLIVSIAYTGLAMIIGVILAYLMVSTDMPFKKVIGILVFIPYILPSWSLALGWIALFRHSEMWIGLPGILQHLTGVQSPEWFVFGPLPIIFCLAANYFAYTYLLAGAAFSTIDSSLEESAQVNGASRSSVLSRITLPLILPALLSAFALTFVSGIGTFGVPQFLGPQADFYVLSTNLYRNILSNRIGEAFVIATIMIFLAMAVVYFNSRILGTRRTFTTLTGKGGHRKLASLGRWRTLAGTVVLIFLIGTAVLPIIILALESTMLRSGEYNADNFTLAYWIGEGMSGQWPGVLAGGRPLAAAYNTIILGIAVGAITTISAALIGYAVVKGRGSRLSKSVDQLSFLPFIIPGAVLGAIYITMFAQPQFFLPSLYGTMALLILAVAVARLPYASRSGVSAMFQVGHELDEAAMLHGASWFRRMAFIIIPLTKHGLFAAFVLAFVEAAKDLDIPIMLAGPNSEVLSVMANALIEYGDVQYGYALALIVVVIVLSGTLIARLVSRTGTASVSSIGTTRNIGGK